jgi:hypothetical protein
MIILETSIWGIVTNSIIKMPYVMYRNSKLGEALQRTLDDLIEVSEWLAFLKWIL